MKMLLLENNCTQCKKKTKKTLLCGFQHILTDNFKIAKSHFAILTNLIC